MDVKLPIYSDLAIDDRDALEGVWDHDFPGNIVQLLSDYIDPPVKSLADIH
jgi:hypothetical protein